MRLETKAPAKVNLSLLIGPVRADGYHELFSVFVPIDVFDGLEFELVARRSREGRGVLRVECEVASGEDNLAARALRSLERATGWVIDGRVGITKGIPAGAGLGGGSSDAAAALRAGAQAIAAAGGPVLGEHELRMLARGVGADVPFFLRPEPSFATGIGDLLEPIGLPPLPLVLVLHEAQLSTAAVYKEFDRIAAEQPGLGAAEQPGLVAGGGPGSVAGGGAGFHERARAHEARWRALAARWAEGRLESDEAVPAIAELLENDLQRASFRLLPGLSEDRDALVEEGALGAVMSGSGPTLLGLCRSPQEAEEVAVRLRLRGYRARLACGAPLS